jgi:alkyldihydroxyacetonephosphate synthase
MSLSRGLCKLSERGRGSACAYRPTSLVPAPMIPARPPDAYPDISWWGWGDPAQIPVLGADVRRLLANALGVTVDSADPPSVAAVRLPPPRLGRDASRELAAIVGHEHAFADDESRIRHTRGKSTLDLLRLRSGDATGAPDLVLLPGSHKEVLELLALCTRLCVAVVPFGGGTSVVGGLEPRTEGFAGVVALDTRRMNALLHLDRESRTAKLQPGLRGPEAEALLAARGYTLGHHPQSFEYATLGGFAAAGSSGQASSGYGRFDQLVLALDVATPVGTLSLGRAPASAAGPDMRRLILGSEGTLGVITSLTLQLRPVPRARVYEAWRFRSFSEGVSALRTLAQDGPLPSVLRLSDEAETALNLARPGQLARSAPEGGCLAIVGYEGAAEEVAARRDAATRTIESAGGSPERGAGEAWERDRYRGPYLRDALLGAGVLVETLETVSFWSSLEGVYEAVRAALRHSLTAQGTPPVILCHVSHVYSSGASLYVTVACAQVEDPVAQWRTAKRAASDAILDAGASISHHHGVGIDHRAWFEREVGELAVEVLRSAKAVLDPAGILNPGVLIAPR